MSLLNQAMYLLNNFCGLSDSRYSTRVMSKCDFFLKRRMKEISAYVLEFMLTSVKMHDSTYCEKPSKTEARAF